MSEQIVPVILSGGVGTRLWPISRKDRPKQLLSLTEPDTMLQASARRVLDGAAFAPPIIVGNAAHGPLIEQQLAAIGVRPDTIITEPLQRNTAPAIALAALHARADALMLVMPSDHVISDVSPFLAAVDAAAPFARQDWLITFGVTPNAAETGYGYISRGAELASGVHQVARFVEKPDRMTAESYLAEGSYYWNSGIFMFRAGAYLDALERYQPMMASATRRAYGLAGRDGMFLRPEPNAIAECPSNSVDYAVLEKAERVAIAPVDMQWSDVGSWDAMHAIASRDAAGNAIMGDVIALDTRDCLIRGDGPLVAAVGVSDLIIVATKDAVLIVRRGASQDVKRAVEALAEQRREV